MKPVDYSLNTNSFVNKLQQFIYTDLELKIFSSRYLELTTAGTCPGITGCPGAIPICCIKAFFKARWLRPFINNWSFKCCGGWKYLQGGLSRLQRPCNRKKDVGKKSVNILYVWKRIESYKNLINKSKWWTRGKCGKSEGKRHHKICWPGP